MQRPKREDVFKTVPASRFLGRSMGGGDGTSCIKPINCLHPGRTNILLMEEILHQLIDSLSLYLQGFIHPRPFQDAFPIENRGCSHCHVCFREGTPLKIHMLNTIMEVDGR